MPKQRITKEMVVEAAFEIAREKGIDHVLVKNIAEKLGCSVQPIYSYCSNMEELKKDMRKRISVFFQEYMATHIDNKDFFKSMGKAYLLLLKEEPNLFEAYYIRKRADCTATSLWDLYEQECPPQMAEIIAKQYSISLEAARELHLNMMVYNIGISSLMISSNFGVPIEELEKKLGSVHDIFVEHARKE